MIPIYAMMAAVMVLGAACTEKPVTPAPTVSVCTDLRDGETFTVRSQDVIESGVALDIPTGIWVKFRDTTGEVRTLFPRDGDYIKCKVTQ